MIVGVINGYYRSGTTALQQYIDRLYSGEIVTIHEPTQHEILEHIPFDDLNRVHSLHGYPVWSGYGKLETHVIREFVKRHAEVFQNVRNWGVMTSIEDAIYLLEPFHESEREIIIKSTQLSLLIKFITDEFDCWAVHTTRDIWDTAYNHFPDEATFVKSLKNGISIPFYADCVYENLTWFLHENPPAKRPIDRLVYNIASCDSIAIHQTKSSDACTLHFDKFVRHPEIYDGRLPFEVDYDVHRVVFNKNKLNSAPNIAKDAVRSSLILLFGTKAIRNFNLPVHRIHCTE